MLFSTYYAQNYAGIIGSGLESIKLVHTPSKLIFPLSSANFYKLLRQWSHHYTKEWINSKPGLIKVKALIKLTLNW